MRDEFGGAQPECVSRCALRAACATVQASQEAWTGPTLTTSAGYRFDLMVDNPWTSLPTAAPFVLDEDRSVVEGQSNLAPGLVMPPVPYLGSPDHAELVLLNLNPGFRDEHVEFMRHPQYDEYVEQNRLGLSFKSRVPFWSLDDTVDAAPGYRWWKQKLREVAEIVGWDFLRDHAFCAQYLPYRSLKFKGPHQPVPSQRFAFQLVRELLARRKPVVVMRAWELWSKAIHELEAHEPRYVLVQPRNAAVSRRNMQPGEFDDLIRLLIN